MKIERYEECDCRCGYCGGCWSYVCEECGESCTKAEHDAEVCGACCRAEMEAAGLDDAVIEAAVEAKIASGAKVGPEIIDPMDDYNYVGSHWHY